LKEVVIIIPLLAFGIPSFAPDERLSSKQPNDWSCHGCHRLGVALFDLERPDVCLQRGDSWMFGPEAPYERTGDVNDVVFPCGQTIGADGDTINLYYGAADSCMAMATGSIRASLAWLERNSSADQTAGR